MSAGLSPADEPLDLDLEARNYVFFEGAVERIARLQQDGRDQLEMILAQLLEEEGEE